MSDKDEQPEVLPQAEKRSRLPYPGFEESHIVRDAYLWMTTQEAATLSGYDIQHIRRLAREGKIGAVKKGRDWWIEYGMFMAFLEGVLDSDDRREGPKGEPNPGALRKPLPWLGNKE